jgi:uncharacterized protein GlcG (DUF336 family)
MKKAIWAGLSSILISTSAMAANAPCPVTSSAALATALKDAVSKTNGAGGKLGFGLNMWATVVAADGRVCAVANSSGTPIQGQWLASRVISAQKAFTAATLSLGKTPDSGSGGAAPTGQFAISTANLYTLTQPGQSLFGLQESNPVFGAGAYGDKINSAGLYTGPSDTALYGTDKDPMVGQVIGGINVFGGGLGLYTSPSAKVGGVGVSGDTSCTDHLVSWYLRKKLNLDHLLGVGGFALLTGADNSKHPDNIVFDLELNDNNSHTNTVGPYFSESGVGHPSCGAKNKDAEDIAKALPDVVP